MARQTKTKRISRETKKSTVKKPTFICFNKDCKLRQQKSCKGFEACPGFQGK